MKMSMGLILPAVLAAAFGAEARPAPSTATWISKEEIEAVEKAVPTGDRNVKVVDIGHENFAVGVVHRGKTVNGRQLERAATTIKPTGSCGRAVKDAPAGAYAGGITHASQAEGYLITSGGGTMFTDGYLVNGVNYDLSDLNGPTCIGPAYGVTIKAVKPGDVIVIPAGVVHGWIDVPDHVDYITFRPSPGVLEGGWVHEAIKGPR